MGETLPREVRDAMRVGLLKAFPTGLLPYLTQAERMRFMALARATQSMLCQHARSEFRRRTITGGSVQLLRQCLDCGVSVGNPAKQIQGANYPAWDGTLAETYQNARQGARGESEEMFWPSYNRYLATDAWRAKRRQVIERCANLCEGCRSAPVDHVHHLTYEHVGRELLFELAGLCLHCHEVAHEEDVASPDDGEAR
jgi:hypothetical protein